MCDFEDVDLISTYPLKQAIEGGMLIEIFKDRWEQLIFKSNSQDECCLFCSAYGSHIDLQYGHTLYNAFLCLFGFGGCILFYPFIFSPTPLTYSPCFFFTSDNLHGLKKISRFIGRTSLTLRS
jgi:hypothetical protein